MTNQNEKPPTNHKQQQHIDRKRKNINNNDNAKSIRINPKHEDMLDLCLWSPNHSPTPPSFSSPPTTLTPSQWQLSLSPLSSQPSAHPPLPQQPNPNPSPPSSPLERAGEREDQGRSEVQELRVRIRNGFRLERQVLTIGGVHMGKQRRNVRAGAGSLDQPDAPQVPLLPPRQQRKTRDKSQPDSHKLALLATGAAARVLHPGSTQEINYVDWNEVNDGGVNVDNLDVNGDGEQNENIDVGDENGDDEKECENNDNQDQFQRKKRNKDGLSIIKTGVDDVRNSVRFINQFESRLLKFSEIVHHLGNAVKKLILDCVTRWNSTYEMLVVAIKVKDTFPIFAQTEPSYKCCSLEDWSKIEHVLSILEVFYEATQVISRTNYPTFNVFLGVVWRVKHVLNEHEFHHEELIRDMNEKMKTKFDKYWGDCNLMMSIGAILDPRYKMRLVDFAFNQIYNANDARINVMKAEEHAYARGYKNSSENRKMTAICVRLEGRAYAWGYNFSRFCTVASASPLVYSQPVKSASPSRGSSSQFSDLAEAWSRLSPLVFTRARPQISESHRFTARSRLALNASNQNLSFFQSVTVQMDFAPFKQWYLQHYGIDIGRKKKLVVAKKETNEVLHYGIDCL
nr:zinc finger BED domain-containing protein RICESLEEPER 2-like [Ipomoea trifida]